MESSSARGPGLLIGLPVLFLVGLIGLVMAIGLIGSGSAGCGSEASAPLSKEVPKQLVPIYDEAAAEYDLGPKGPAVLAAINFVETSFGTNVATSSAGANGWMAFLPSTWETWGVDGDHDGDKDPYDATDAIFSAANYLRDSGAPEDWWEAIFAYNHAGWYVEKVLRYAKEFTASGGGGEAVAVSACVAGAPSEAVARMVAEAARLSALRPTADYVWGGSHGETPTPANGPFDCSSAVSHLLQVGGIDIPTMNTEGLLEWGYGPGGGGETGRGQWVTIWDKPFGGDAHTFIEFMPGVTPPSQRYWGTSGMWFPGHGPGFIPEHVFDAGYLSGFVQMHPPGM